MRAATQILVLLLVVGLGVEVVVLSMQKRRQRSIIEALVEGQAKEVPAPAAGDRLPVDRLSLLPIGDEAAPVREVRFLPEEPCRLVFLFNTRCPICAETAPAWRGLAGKVGGGPEAGLRGEAARSVEVMAIASDTAEAIDLYRQRTDFGAPFYRLEGPPYTEALGVRFVPHTFLLSPRGVVLGIWPQALDETDVDQIENLIGAACSTADADPKPPSAAAERKEVS